MQGRTRLVSGIEVPTFFYGTAWKEGLTSILVTGAIEAGFRAIDTANQRKHYFEAAVGEGIANAIARGVVTRESLFLQTKYTFRDGQDDRLPYDPRAKIRDQVHQSLASSLAHLKVDRIDSLVLHGPSQRFGLASADWEAWHAMEELHAAGKVRALGVSNVSADQLAELTALVRIKPRFVQNRCHAIRGWDQHVRDIADRNGIVYQGYSLLTANRDALAKPEIANIAARHRKTVAQVVFRFAQRIGMIPITGTTDEIHMREDLAIDDFDLDAAEVEAILRSGR